MLSTLGRLAAPSRRVPYHLRGVSHYRRTVINDHKVEIVHTDAAPAYVKGLPKIQAVQIPGNVDLIYTSAIFPVDKDGNIVGSDVKTLTNLSILLGDCGSNIHNTIKSVVYLRDLNDFDQMNEVYKLYFNKIPPARDCCSVDGLPIDVKIAVSIIALPSKPDSIFRKYISHISTQYHYPRYVWSVSAGWWPKNIHWLRNTGIAFVGLGLMLVPIAMYSQKQIKCYKR